LLSLLFSPGTFLGLLRRIAGTSTTAKDIDWISREPARIRLVDRIISGNGRFRRESGSTETGLMSVSWEGDVPGDVVSGPE
jgi:hypothetical protein